MKKNLKNTEISLKKEQAVFYKIRNWAKAKAWPWLNAKAFKAWSILKKITSKLKMSWVGILALVILVKMAQSGQLNEMPNLKWLIESGIRLTEWVIGLLRDVIEWVVDFPKFKMFDFLDNWLKNMFSL